MLDPASILLYPNPVIRLTCSSVVVDAKEFSLFDHEGAAVGVVTEIHLNGVALAFPGSLFLPHDVATFGHDGFAEWL